MQDDIKNIEEVQAFWPKDDFLPDVENIIKNTPVFEIKETMTIQDGSKDIELAHAHKDDTYDEFIELRNELRDDKKKGIIMVANHFIENYNIKTIGNRDSTKDIYLYKDGVYRFDGGYIIKEILRFTGGVATQNTRNEIYKTIKEKTWEEKDTFTVPAEYINLKNGIYNIKSKDLLPHNPEFRFLHQIPVVYDKNADCPKIKKFLNQILDEDSIKVIQEWSGFCLYRIYFIKKAIICLGEGDTGKTTLLKLLWRLLGKENTSSIDLQRFSQDKFSLSNLHNKLANIFDELSPKNLNDNVTFKMLTGGSEVPGEKKFGELFSFTNYAKLTFSCNKIPEIKNVDDEPFFSRWIIIRFDQHVEKPDPFLFEKMSTEEEISGLLNFALEGLDRLLVNHKFSYTQTPEEIKAEMCSSTSSLAKFAITQLEVVSDPDIFITKEQLEQEFISFASREGLPVMSSETIGKKLPKYISIRAGRKNIQNTEKGKVEQVNCWIGVRFKNPELRLATNKNNEPLKVDPFDF